MIGGTGMGTGGSAGVLVAGFGGSGVAIGARTSGDFTAAESTRGGGGGLGLGGGAGADRAGGAAGLFARADVAAGAAAGAGRAGPPDADSLIEIEPPEPGTGNTSSALMPGGRLASQTNNPSTMTWRDSEPDMQTPNVSAEGLRPGGVDGAS
ncbi:MAG TPA: hypothetical protein VFX14_14565 [Methylomirabilota bacterium]|nr:hypothetical protein [Methylomirabilota bacterium]